MPAPSSPLSPRQRRLMADYEAIRAELAGHPNVTVEPIGALPPERYRITYRLKSLVLEGDQPVVAHEHRVEVVLPLGYPRVGPVATPKSAVFHPNIDATKYCIADYWSAGQPLVDIIRKIGDMLQFRVYNVKSPLNATGARWVNENESLLPIDDVNLGTPDFEIALRPASPDAPEVLPPVEPQPASEAAPGEPEGKPGGSDEPDVRKRTEIIL